MEIEKTVIGAGAASRVAGATRAQKNSDRTLPQPRGPMTDSDDGRIDEYIRAATRHGFTALDVTLDTGGVILERSAA